MNWTPNMRWNKMQLIKDFGGMEKSIFTAEDTSGKNAPLEAATLEELDRLCVLQDWRDGVPTDCEVRRGRPAGV